MQLIWRGHRARAATLLACLAAAACSEPARSRTDTHTSITHGTAAPSSDTSERSAAPAPSTTATPHVPTGVEVRDPAIEAVVREVTTPDGPGGVVLAAKDGKIVHEAAYGLADIDAKRPMTLDAVFDLASVSKHFTALAVALLAERGALSLDDEIATHVPELRGWGRGRPIRVRDLVHMVAGLPGYEDFLDDLTGETNDSVIAALAKQRPAARAGETYEYSNLSYVVLATIVARASKKSFHDFLRAEIFERAGMTRTTMIGSNSTDRARGYQRVRRRFEIDSYDIPGIVGDGNVLSTAGDLYRYDRALRAGRLVSKNIAELTVTPGKTDSGEEHGYAFGWSIESFGGSTLASHDGSWNGTATYFGRLLDADVTVIVLLNLTDAEAWDTGRKIEALLHGRAPPAEAPRRPKRR